MKRASSTRGQVFYAAAKKEGVLKNLSINKWIFSTIGVLILIVIWQLLSIFAGSFIVPSPWTSLRETIFLLMDPYNWKQILITLGRVGAGFMSAFVMGTVVGIITGKQKALESICKPVILFLQGIPPLLWAIPLILIFGTGHLSPIIVIALICFPLVALNIAQGMGTIPKNLVEMVKVFAPGAYPRMREVIFPHLNPFFSASLKLGVTLGIKASVIGEYFGANNGIGFQIQAAYQSLQIRKLFSWGIILIFLILFISRILSLFEKLKIHVSSMLIEKKVALISKQRGEKLNELRILKRNIAQLSLQDITFFYTADRIIGGIKPERKKILEGINILVPPDKTAVISGESGVGKTTLLMIAAGVIQPTQGKVIRPEKTGFVFQDDRLIPWRTTLRNCAVPLIYQGYSLKNALSISQNLISEVGLSGFEMKLPEELSGGMKKRAAIARCFARNPELILLDEPFSGLHREARRYLWENFFGLLKFRPVPTLIVTHFPEEISFYPNLTFYKLDGKPAHLIEIDPETK